MAGWDSSTQILTAPFTKIALNGQGDLQLALGRTTCFSEIQLVADIDSAGQDVGKINIWAKYKPFRSTTAAYSFDSSKSTPALRSPDRWAAALNANYGLNIQSPSGAALGTPTSGFFANILAGSLPWVYQKPVSGTNPLRALDFDGYYAGALTLTPQVTSQPPAMLTADSKLTVQWLTSFASPQVEQLQYTDIKLGSVTLDQCYYGMLLYNPNNGNYAYVANQKIADGNFDVTFNLTGLESQFQGATCKVVPFICTNSISQGGTPVSSARLASWNCLPVNINVQAHTGNFDTTLSASWNSAGTEISWTLTVKNNSGSQRTVSNIYVYLAVGSQDATPTSTSGPYSMTVAGNGGTATKTGTITAALSAQRFYVIAQTSTTTDIPRTVTNVRLPIEEI